MKLLFDQGVPVPLRRRLAPHVIDRACERGWPTFENGALLDVADQHWLRCLCYDGSALCAINDSCSAGDSHLLC